MRSRARREGRGERPPQGPVDHGGLLSLRRTGKLTEVLFLQEIATHPFGRLRPIAERLGVSVQAVSLVYRRLAREGKVGLVGGRYWPTPMGVDALHHSLASIRSDLEARFAALSMVQNCRAIAKRAIAQGTPVVLYLEDGLLHARPGKDGPSRGIATKGAEAGELVEVEQLKGILPITVGRVVCLTVPAKGDLGGGSRASQLLRHLIDRPRTDLLAAEGLEAVHLLREATDRPFTRLGVAAAAREAATLGMSVTVVVTDERLPSLLQQLSEHAPAVPFVVRTLALG